MGRRNRNAITIALFILVVVGLLGLTRNDRPLLGLDLQGGISVTLQPVGNPPISSVEQAKNIINQRVDALGVAEPDIVRQDRTIVVQLPGVKNKAEALKVIGRTAKLQFQPVLAAAPAGWTYSASKLTCSATPLAPTTTTTPGATTTTAPGSTTTAPAASTTAPVATTTTAGSNQSGAPAIGAAPGGQSAVGPLPSQNRVQATVPAGGASTTAATATTVAASPTTVATPPTSPATTPTPTPTAGANPDKTTGAGVYPYPDGNTCVQLGPVGFEGKGLSSAQAETDPTTGAWDVNVKVKGGTKGQANTLMNSCNSVAATCPKTLGQTYGSMAIVLDGSVQSAPEVQSPNLASNAQGFQITGSFTSTTAKSLALVLKYGALPVVFKNSEVQEVSASLGKDSLHAGIIAGLVGLGLVVLYVLLYYRLLGAVAVLSLSLAAGLLWAVIAYLGTSHGLALDLSGITGIIVSIGIAVDSNVVFYEHIREDISKGRTFKSVVSGSFTSAWRTIVAADLVSLIAAGLLYLLTIGAVRGFAFFLGLSTVLDLVASYFLMRPLVFMIARNDSLVARPGLLGLKVRANASTAPEATS